MSEIKFPCLMQNNNFPFVVCFTQDKVGTVVLSEDNRWPVGLQSQTWSSFYPKRNSSSWKSYNKPENKTMNVSAKTIEALARLEAIEIEQKELRKILEAPEEEEVVVGSLLSYCEDTPSNSLFSWKIDHQIGTTKLAGAYSAAFETFIHLRQQPGSVAAKDGEEQWTIELDYNMKNPYSRCFDCLSYKATKLSPCFSSEQHAFTAIEAVGEENIIQMFKTFSHYKEI